MKIKILISISALILTAGIIGCVFIMCAPQRSMVNILIDGNLLYTFDLSNEPDRTFIIESSNGTNTVQIENSRIRIIESDCENKTCIHMGWLKSAPIVCLPHRLVIEFTDTRE